VSTGCSFSNGFNSGFAICVPAAAVEPLRGVPGVGIVRRRRRLRPVELEGAGRVFILARGELAADRALAGVATLEPAGRGLLSLEQRLRADPAAAVLRLAQQALATVRTALAGLLLLPAPAGAGRLAPARPGRPSRHLALAGEGVGAVAVGAGQLRALCALTGAAALAVRLAGEPGIGRVLAGAMALEAPTGAGAVHIDDEETALALLGLPSEVMV